MSSPPTVSVIIPVYNGERYVADAIGSILSQSFKDFELILIDDASTDGSLEVLRSQDDQRIRIVRNDVNLGLARTHNRGLDLARGRYLAMLDHDDWSEPERLAKQVAFLDRHEDHVLVGSWAATMDAQGRTRRRRKRYPLSADEIQAGLLFGCCVFHPSITARTEVMRAYRYSDRFAICDDFDLFVRLSRSHKLANLPSVLVRHRRHESRTSEKNAHLKKGENVAIFRGQLTELGVSCNDLDLDRHFLLGQMKTVDFRPDGAYLDWAERWLSRLQAANQQCLRYTEPAFSAAARKIWLKACWHASGNVGWPAWRQYFRSDLRAGLWSIVGGSLASMSSRQKHSVT